MDFEGYFDLDAAVFPSSEIERRRAVLGDTLLYDILLSLGGIRDPDTLYPPHDPDALSRLLAAIASSTYDSLKRDCLVYFLLKWYQDGRENRFKADRCIPPQFALLADAYWFLDAGLSVSRAVSILSDSRLNRDYATKILQAISTIDSPDSHALVVRYVRTAKPLLTEPDDSVLYALSLAQSTSLFEAWQFQRSFSESDPTRTLLLHKLFEWCVSPTPRITPLTHLLSLPLTAFEQSALHTYASSPTSSSSAFALATLQSLSCTRLIQTGAYAAAITLHRKFESASTALLSHPQAKNSIQDRAVMIQSLYAALPAFERALLDDEIEQGDRDVPMSSTQARTNANAREIGEDVQMSVSQSWEDLGMPPAQPNGVDTPSAATTVTAGSTQPHSGTATPRVPASFSLGASLAGAGVVSSRPGASATRFGGAPSVLPSSASTSTPATTNAFGMQTGTGFVVGGLNGSGIGSGSVTMINPPPLLSQSQTQSQAQSKETRTPRQSLPFSTSGRKQNAFYKPPATLGASSAGFKPTSNKSPERAGEKRRVSNESKTEYAGEGENEDAGEEKDKGMDVDSTLDEFGGSGGGGLNYSLFANTSSSEVNHSQTRSRTSFGSMFPKKSLSGSVNQQGASLNLSTSSRKRPPGAFDDGDDDDDDDDDGPGEAISSRTTTFSRGEPKTKTSRTATSLSHGEPQPSSKSKSTSKSSKTRTKPKTSSKRESTSTSSSTALKRSVPGGMYPSLSLSGSEDDYDEEDGEDEGRYNGSENEQDEGTETEDMVPPLRTSSRRTTGTGARKTRASLASAADGDDVGAGGRRRSSRLLGTPVSGAAGAKGKGEGKGRTRKSVAGAGTGVGGDKEAGVKTRSSGVSKRRGK